MSLLICAPASAGAPTEQLRHGVESILQAQSPETGRQDRARLVRAVLDDLVDWHSVTKGTLGWRWRQLSATDRRVVADRVAQLFARLGTDKPGQPSPVSSRRVMAKARALEQRIVYGNETIVGNNAVVETTVRGHRDVKVDFEMHRRGERWQIHDVTVDGVSIVGNYRAQIDRIMPGSPHRLLVTLLDSKLAQLEPRDTRQAVATSLWRSR